MNFKRYVEASDTWVDSHYIKKTDTDIITTLPATIYPLAQSVTIGLKGNTVQNGTPTPDNPVPVVGVGDLDNGQYKIPISSASITTSVYLGEVETTRKIGKYIFTGQENITRSISGGKTRMYYVISAAIGASPLYCTHYPETTESGSYPPENTCRFNNASTFLIGVSNDYMSADEYKAWLQQQYANGTPVTVWYVLATEGTAVVNEPLMKIGDYADSISGISIPTTAGANTLDVQTTVKPSEVTAAFNGWHPVSSAHECSGGAWT